jgi:hypothetical protein
LATPDEALTWYEYRALFQVGVPAGSYQESAYFLPLAFDYMRLNPDKSLDCISDVAWFISEHADSLTRDNLIEPVRHAVKDCLHVWTSTFVVVYFDEKACAKKGWKLKRRDYVRNQEVVGGFLESLDRFGRLGDLADSFLDELIKSSQPEKAAWTIELECRESLMALRLPDRDSPRYLTTSISCWRKNGSWKILQ